MSDEVIKVGVRVFMEDIIGSLKEVSEHWSSRYVPETSECSTPSASDEAKLDIRDVEEGSIYASPGSGKFGFKLSLQERLNGLREEGAGLDIEVVIGRQEVVFEAHKIVLANASPFFYSAIFGGLRQIKRLKIPDCQPEIFRIILNFIYTTKYGPDLSFEMAMQAIDTAKKFGIQEFSDKIYDFFSSNISHENVLDLLNSPYHLHMRPPRSNNLEMLCQDIIENRTAKVLSHNLDKMDIRKLCLILHNNSLKISEIELFEFVYKWSKIECKRQELDLTPLNIRKVGDLAFKLLRIPIISLEDFKNIIEPTQVLTADEVSILITWKNSSGGPFLPGVDFSTRHRIGGIPGMTDFPPLQYEFGCFKAGSELYAFTDYIGSKGSSTSSNPETRFTQEKLDRLIELLTGIQKVVISFVGRVVEAKTKIDPILQQVGLHHELNHNLIPDDELD